MFGVNVDILQIGEPAVMGSMSYPPQWRHSTLVADRLQLTPSHLMYWAWIGVIDPRMVRYLQTQP